MLKQIHQLINNHYEEMVEIRRHLHQYPEVSFQEFKTAKYIADFYEKLKIKSICTHTLPYSCGIENGW